MWLYRNKTFVKLAVLYTERYEWQGLSPLVSAWATQLQRVVAALATLHLIQLARESNPEPPAPIVLY